MILKYPTKQTQKIHEAKTVCQKSLTDSYVCSNFLFHRTWWVSQPPSAVCHTCQHQAVGSRCIPRVCMALPGHSCCFRAQSWPMAAGESLGSPLKSAPLESKKGHCCIPACPWDLCKAWAGQPALFTILEVLSCSVSTGWSIGHFYLARWEITTWGFHQGFFFFPAGFTPEGNVVEILEAVDYYLPE